MPKAPSPKSSHPPTSSGGAPAASGSARPVGVVRGAMDRGEKIGIYGPGGIGKTELVASMIAVGIDPLFIDLDQGTMGLDVARATVDGGDLVQSFDDIRKVLQSRDIIGEFGAVVIDTFSTLEDRIREYVIRTILHEKGHKIKRIDDYGFGKGYNHIFETALLILQDLDAIARDGIHVVVVCHQCAERVPSAESEDYLEYQPRLQSPPRTGKIRERIFEWCNHFFRIDHDRIVDDGHATKGDVRTIHTVRTTTAWAKHRSIVDREIPESIPYPKGSHELWQIMFG